MLRTQVTEDLAKFLKYARNDRNITLKQLSNCVGKSTAYISNIENQKIVSVRTSELYLLFECLIGDEDALRCFLNSKTDTVDFLNNLNTGANILAVFDYDATVRQIGIPSSLIDRINFTLKLTKTSYALLYKNIKDHESQLNDKAKNLNIKSNKCFSFEDSISLVVDIEYDELENILSKRITRTSYAYMFIIVFAMLKMMMQDAGIINEANQEILEEELVNNAHDYLFDFKFYSLMQISYEKSKKDNDSEANTETPDSETTIKRIDSILRLYLETDGLNNGNELTRLLYNLQWDLNFLMSILSLPFYILKDMSYSNKKKLLSEFQRTLEYYISMPNDERSKEIY